MGAILKVKKLMSKRSHFEKIPRDLYETVDPRAMAPNFVKYLEGKTFYEPCVGSGKLVDQLEGAGSVCVGASDIEPLGEFVNFPKKNGLELTPEDVKDADFIVTNPPFTKDTLLPLIDHWVTLKSTWVLLPADLAYNAYMVPYMARCSHIVALGRMYWFKHKWVVKEPFDFDDLDKKWDRNIEFYDSMKGIKYYTGWLSSDGKPKKQEIERSTDNFAFYCFQKEPCKTIFETRGES